MKMLKALTKRYFILGILFSLIFFIVGIITLSDYGTNWDEARHYYRGQAIARFLLTGERDYKNLHVNNRSIYQQDKYTLSQFFSNDPVCCHPPFNDTVASMTNLVFYQQLGILDDIEGYHFFVLFVSSILTGLVFYFAASEYGLFAGLVAFLSLSLYPFFLGESRFNIKDPVETSFYSLAIYFFYRGITKSHPASIMASSVFAGMAIGTKFNFFLAPVIILPWLVFYHWKKIKSLQWPFSSRITLAFIIYPIVAFGILYVFWPLLWQSPIEGLLRAFQYYKEVGYSTTYQPERYLIFGTINTYAAQWIFFTTPIVILFLSLWGIVYTFKNGLKEKRKTGLLVFLWFLIPILRVTVIPNAGLFLGVRHIMEYIPAMAILSGIGAHYIVTKAQRFKGAKWTLKPLYLQAAIILMFIPITFKLISIHPNENVYFNPLVGGLKGARDRNVQYWGTSYGNVYRQAANWLNKNAKPNAKVTLGVMSEESDNFPKIWLRADLDISDKYWKNYLQKRGEYIFEMTSDFPTWLPYCNWVYVRNFLEPVYEVKVDDVAILTIWKNDLLHTKKEYLSKKSIENCIER